MISIIISSANNIQLQQVTQNIAETVGVPFEIISIDNSKGQQGICSAYNSGISRAKYDIVCFMHEDIIIQTNNWGFILNNIFSDNAEVGLIGVVGSGYKPFAPSGWGGIDSAGVRSNILQSYKYAGKPLFHHYNNPDNLKLEQVACVDGVLMVSTKTVLSEYKFDENLFQGFHAYDIDLSIAIGQRYKVVVTYEILINHLSEGNYNREWIDDVIKLHKKWKPVLPININNLSYAQSRLIEKRTFSHFLRLLIKFNFTISVANKILWGNKKYREANLFWKLHFLIFKAYLKRDRSH